MIKKFTGRMFIFLMLATVGGAYVSAQTQKISKEEYDKAFDFAVSNTNADYPVVLTVVTTLFKNGKIVSTETETTENESEGKERTKITTLKNGKATNIYQITVGFSDVFCSDDGINWKPSEYLCRKTLTIFGSNEPESTAYSVATKSLEGKQMKIYREYSVFAPFTEGGKKVFHENISTIDGRGFLVTIEGTEGTLAPKVVTLTRKQSWTTKAKIKPIVAPVQK